MKKYGFIGAGNMGGALAKAVARKVKGENVMITDLDTNKVEALCKETGAKYGNIESVVDFADYLFIGVKPQGLASLFDVLAPVLEKKNDRIILVSMCAGTAIEKIKTLAGKNYPVIRIMPNVACSAGEGMTLCAPCGEVSEDELNEFMDTMSLSGLCETIQEKLIDAASAVSGCGPAYVFMMAEAMADGLVACGVPRNKAYTFASQTLLGSAKLMQESGKCPAELKDSVCSPGGTTIEGVAALENGGFRAAVINAVKAAYEKNFKL